MPHVPQMRVAALVLGAELFVVGAWGTGPVWRFGVQPFDDAIEDAAELGEIVLPHLHAHVRGKLVASGPVEGGLSFVVAGPKNDAGMVAQAADLVFGFSLHRELETVGPRLPVVAVHEVLPNHDAELVADLVELVALVVAATPMANHVHVGVASRLKDAAIVRRRDAIRKAVEWNDVRAFGEDGYPVDDKLKAAAPLVG